MINFHIKHRKNKPSANLLKCFWQFPKLLEFSRFAKHLIAIPIALLLFWGYPSYAKTIQQTTSQTTLNNFDIIVSIKPIHSIVQNILGTQTTSIKAALLDNTDNPHHFHFTPAHREKIVNSQMLIYIDGHFETSIEKNQHLIPKQVRQVKISQLNNLSWHSFAESQSLNTKTTHQHSNSTDFHFWLDIDRVILVTQQLTPIIASLDPNNQAHYQHNSQQFIHQLKQLKKHIQKTLSTLMPSPYITIHQAYQYFEKAFHLHSQGTLTLNPHHHITSGKFVELAKQLNQQKITCLFYDPDFPQRIIKKLQTIADNNIKTLTLDPIGEKLTPGANLYPQLMQRLLTSFQQCFTN